MLGRLLALCVVLAAVPAVADDKKPVGRAEKAPSGPPDKPKMLADRVVAIVDNAIILETELEARMLPLVGQLENIQDPSERERRLGKLRIQVLDDMINEELIVQAGEAAKIEVDSSEVQAALDEIKQQNNLDDKGLEELLKQQGFTMANYRQDLRRQILRLRAINQLVAPKVQVTDEDVRARYDELQRRSQAVSAVRLARILIKLPEHPTQQDIEEAKKKASDALARVKAGEDFAAVAAAVSEDTSTAQAGGDLGWFERGSLNDPGLENIVFSMEKDDVRGPVGSSEGFQVLKAVETKSSGLKPFAQMKEQLKGELRRKEMDKQTALWLEELRKKAYIDIKN